MGSSLSHTKMLLEAGFIAIMLCIPAFLMAQGKGSPEALMNTADSLYSQGQYTEAARLFNQAAFQYWENESDKKAAEAFEKSLLCNEQIGNKNGKKVILGHLGQLYYEMGNWNQSIRHFENQLAIARQQNRKTDIATVLINLSNVYLASSEITRAIKSLEEASSLSAEANHIPLLKNSYALLAQAYDKAGDTQKSRDYFDKYATLDKHIQQQAMQQKEAEAEQKVEQAQTQAIQAEEEKQKTRIELGSEREKRIAAEQTIEKVEQLTAEQKLQIELLEKESLLKEQQIRNQQLIRRYMSIIIGGMLIFIATIIFAYRQKQKDNKLLARQKKEIELKNTELNAAFEEIKRQNKNITDSIEYAERIQNALLPPVELLKTMVPESFIFLRARDIVSGDFFWANRYFKDSAGRIYPIDSKDIPSDAKPLTILACIDCTGHGVPGAFMSMIGFNLLEKLIRKNITEPGKLLTALHQSIRKALKQQINRNNDGMDMSICLIDEKSMVLEYAGARNPLLISEEQNVRIVKGDGVSIGGIQFEAERVFNTKEIKIRKGMKFYMYSDGFIDQFGGPEPFKYTSARLRSFIKEISSLSMDEQGMRFEKEFDLWKGEQPQLDDVLVMGFSFDKQT